MGGGGGGGEQKQKEKKHLAFHFTQFKGKGNSFKCFVVAVCALLIMDESLEAEEAIKKIRELRGPGAIQSVKVLLN